MNTIWVVLISTTLLVFWTYLFYRLGVHSGYKKGANAILNHWKDTLYEEENL